jgi:hypothetical protein
MQQEQCPNCGHDWTAHSDFIVRQERMCEERLDGKYEGYSLHYHYTAENTLWFVQAWEGDVFVTQHFGDRAAALCKQSITKRINPAGVYNAEMDERNRIAREHREKPWLPIQPGQEDW